MIPFPIPPRRVDIGDAAAFVGITPGAIRRYEEVGLLPERDGDDARRYGYDEMIRLLWIRRMADAGIALDDIRDALVDTAPAGATARHDVLGVVGRLGLLSDVVRGRLEALPDGSLRQADLDGLLVTERIFGPLGAAIQASRFIALATHPGLREESDRVDAAEEALDDTVAVDDPRVVQVAAERHAFDLALDAVIEESGLAESDEALFDSWDASHPASDIDGEDEVGTDFMSAVEAAGKMPYDFSPARLRCMELAVEMAAEG
jgi:DNA-binding transcriptional MerR regulator